MVVRLTGWWLGDKEEEALSLLKKRKKKLASRSKGRERQELGKTASTSNATRAAQSRRGPSLVLLGPPNRDVSPTVLFSAVLKATTVSGLGSSFSTPREMWHSEKHRTPTVSVAVLYTGR
jgi:hypothetical protein